MFLSLSQHPFCCYKTSPPKQLKEERAYVAGRLLSIIKEAKAGTQDRNQGRVLLTDSHSTDGSARFPIQPKIICPRVGGTTLSGLGSLASIINQENAHRHAHRPI